MDPIVQQSGTSLMTTIDDSSQLLGGVSLMGVDNENKKADLTGNLSN